MDATRTSPPAIQRRARQILSCSACRTGKLKCNREQPCDQCIKRSKDNTCHYLPPPQKKRKIRNARDRVAHLEGLVAQLIAQNTTDDDANDDQKKQANLPVARKELGDPVSPFRAPRLTDDFASKPMTPPSEETSPRNLDQHSPSSEPREYQNALHAVGALSINHGVTSYVGATHWKAVLEHIAELKADLDDDDQDVVEEDLVDVPDAIPGQMPRLSMPNIEFSGTFMSKQQLIASMPPKSLADRLVWQYFTSPDPGLALFHKPTFQKEYTSFWANPSGTPTMWIAMLFGILCLGKRIGMKSNKSLDELAPDQQSPEDLQRLAAAAITLADYTRPKRYTMEALMIYAGCEYIGIGRETDLRLWCFMGTAVRIALYMGYHRDPDHYPQLSPFDGEIRRRVWHQCIIFDVLTSFTLGLPSMILHTTSDTKPASNFLDSDFGPESTALPPPRPMHELSPVSYAVIKARIVKVFAMASEASHAVEPPSLERVQEIDEALEQARTEMPRQLQYDSVETSYLDQPAVIFHRFKLEMLYQKTKCILHRRWLTEHNTDSAFDWSRENCADAAMKLLNVQEVIEQMTREDGPLRDARWFLRALGTQDFLTAAMILCLKVNLLTKEREKSPVASSPLAGEDDPIDEIRRRLTTSYNIFCKIETTDQKALKAMHAMLLRITLGGTTGQFDLPSTFVDPSMQSTYNTSYPSGSTLSFDTFSPNPLMSTNQSTDPFSGLDAGFFGPLDGLTSNPDQSVNWKSWDNNLGQNLIGDTRVGMGLDPSYLDPSWGGTWASADPGEFVPSTRDWQSNESVQSSWL